MSKVVHTKKKFDAKSQQIAIFLTNIIDFFYPPFKRLMPIQTFRYAACGGGNQLFNIFIFSFSENFIFRKQVVHLGFIHLESFVAAVILAFCITFPIGFLLAKYVVFNESDVRSRHQAVRYIGITAICLFLNYIFMKLFVQVFHWYPTPSYLLTIVIVVTFSYFSQKKFAFK